ncbi:MAG: hypothetical protein ABIU05_11285 [Nitrospirales bacterium]
MLNYVTLSQQQYADLLVNQISSAEGPAPNVYQKPGDHTTIGYGYTFVRSNNLQLWQNAGITLTSSEVTLLQSIDAAPTDAQRDSLALQFTRTITQGEAIVLLRQTYPEYEGPANALGMPFSEERAAFVSLTYNRGVGTVNTKMQAFFAAIGNQDRAEAWYQIRYNSNGRINDPDLTQGANGIANRRIAESNLFSLYDNPGQGVGEAEAKEVLRMYTTHRTDIQTYESKFSSQFAQSGTATIQFQLISAETTLIANFAEGRTIDGEVLVGQNDLWRGDILEGTMNGDLLLVPRTICFGVRPGTTRCRVVLAMISSKAALALTRITTPPAMGMIGLRILMRTVSSRSTGRRSSAGSKKPGIMTGPVPMAPSRTACQARIWWSS